jgi:hypothetical protein
MNCFRNAPTAFLIRSSCCVFIIPAYGYTDPNTVCLAPLILAPLLLALGVGGTFLGKYLGAALAPPSRRLRRWADV